MQELQLSPYRRRQEPPPGKYALLPKIIISGSRKQVKDIPQNEDNIRMYETERRAYRMGAAENRVARAEIISGATHSLREAVRQLEPIEAGLSAEDIARLSIILGLDAQIRREQEQRPKLYIVREEEPIG